ncbi:hypothetical protein B0T16DRAFT_383803 [Cercophora newfieldiana]|uniref:Uncharacterized protein n=1 Tax=Cercophora newfieldiana TaxID=92897 RepID=A0AA39YLG4_9PEZI|nr:hypothetical protein B0T16DRAFT_383803 [Cercophora newfieldiana]
MESQTYLDNRAAEKLSAAIMLLAGDAAVQHNSPETMALIRKVPAILSEAASLVLGKIWTAASQSWYAKAAAFFFAARPFLLPVAIVWGLKKAAEIQGRSLEKAAEIQGRSLEKAAEIQVRSLEKAAEIQGRSLENAARILA